MLYCAIAWPTWRHSRFSSLWVSRSIFASRVREDGAGSLSIQTAAMVPRLSHRAPVLRRGGAGLGIMRRDGRTALDRRPPRPAALVALALARDRRAWRGVGAGWSRGHDRRLHR